MKNRNRRWLMAWTFASLFPHIMLYDIQAEDGTRASKKNGSEHRGVFAPRMDYEHWTPLGRSDPLKNEPTYDYVPPVLEKVHYWIDPASRKPDGPPQESQKTEILVLGLSSKKPSTIASAHSRIDTYDPFMKFVEGPKFGNQNYQRMSRPYYHTAQYYPVNSNLVNNKNEQRIPYTMLMPPPLQQDDVKTYQNIMSSSTTENANQSNMATSPSTSTSTSTPTESSVTVQYANLLYQSSSLGKLNEFNDKNPYGTAAAASSSQETWITPVLTQTDKIITSGHQIRFPESYMEMQTFFPKSNSTEMKVNSVQSPGMHKGQVADGDLGLGNSYVNIGKSEAQMHSPTGMEIPAMSVPPPKIPMRKPLMPMMSTKTIIPASNIMPFQTLQTMQTMQPPPVVQPSSMAYSLPVTSLQKLLQKEVTKTIPPTTTTPSTNPTTTMATTTMESPTITTTTSLTTDPLFKHYKQPSEPIRGPMYLIIQGHSKVKTYGPSKQLHGIAVDETNQILTHEEKDRYRVKHLHEYRKESNEIPRREGRSGNLQTLSHVVETGLGAIDVHKDVKEALVGFSYDVAAMGDFTTARYYKGVVETGDMERNNARATTPS